MNDYTLKWNRLTMKRLPPKETTFLLWMGLKDSDGGFPVIAKLYYDSTNTPYIIFRSADDKWKLFLPCEWDGMLWATIPMPEQARKMYEKDLEIKRSNGVVV